MTSGVAMVKNARRRRLMKMHRNAVIFVVPAFALLTSWMQKSFKNVKNSPKNDHKKYEARFCNGQTRASSADVRKCIKTRSFLSLPVSLCSRHGCKIPSKSSKIIDGDMHCVCGRARREAGQFGGYSLRKSKTPGPNHHNGQAVIS